MKFEHMWNRFLKEVIKPFESGIRAGDRRIFLKKFEGGRFKEEFNLILSFEEGGRERHLAYVKVFLGRGYYREWAEIFGVNPQIVGTEVETRVFDVICPFVGRIFVEYFEDRETVKELDLGMPIPLSRLGFELGRRGFTWFKNWYFPEGLMEGGHKIQGEKATDRKRREDHIRALRRQYEEFLNSPVEVSMKEKATERYKILQNLWKE